MRDQLVLRCVEVTVTVVNRYYAKRPGGAAYEYTEDELWTAFDGGEVDGWLARRSDLPDWVPVEEIFQLPAPTARRVVEPSLAPLSVADLAGDLQRLHDLKTSGLIDETEYAALKQTLIARITAPATTEQVNSVPHAETVPRDIRRDRRPIRLEPHRGEFILTLGLLSFIPFLCFLGLFAMSGGHHDLHRMREGYMDASGRTLTRIGVTLGTIVSVLLLLTCLSGVFAILAR